MSLRFSLHTSFPKLQSKLITINKIQKKNIPHDKKEQQRKVKNPVLRQQRRSVAQWRRCCTLLSLLSPCCCCSYGRAARLLLSATCVPSVILYDFEVEEYRVCVLRKQQRNISQRERCCLRCCCTLLFLQLRCSVSITHTVCLTLTHASQVFGDFSHLYGRSLWWKAYKFPHNGFLPGFEPLVTRWQTNIWTEPFGSVVWAISAIISEFVSMSLFWFTEEAQHRPPPVPVWRQHETIFHELQR